MVVGSGYTIKAFDESSWDAFARLVEANNGVFGGCWCIGFHPDDSREPARLQQLVMMAARRYARRQAPRWGFETRIVVEKGREGVRCWRFS